MGSLLGGWDQFRGDLDRLLIFFQKVVHEFWQSILIFQDHIFSVIKFVIRIVRPQSMLMLIIYMPYVIIREIVNMPYVIILEANEFFFLGQTCILRRTI